MINSLTELDEAIKSGQQFERKPPTRKEWVSVESFTNYNFHTVVTMIRFGRLRVKQVKT